jgi:Ran GTPase-activating protein (RanGAP) involved in mRNA processing and transport
MEKQLITLHTLKNRYDAQIYEQMVDSLFDTPVHDLVEELIGRMGISELDRWAESIQEDCELSNLYRDGNGSMGLSDLTRP